jgi:hypothetical protein
MNVKGIREKALIEAIKTKCMNMLKLKGREDMEDESKNDSSVYENGGLNDSQALDNATWFCREKPKINKYASKLTRRQLEELAFQNERDEKLKRRLERERPSMEGVKALILDIESAYTDWATPLSREWELKYMRDMTREQI